MQNHGCEVQIRVILAHGLQRLAGAEERSEHADDLVVNCVRNYVVFENRVQVAVVQRRG